MPLPGWDDAKKYKVSIDHTKVDSTLTNFPILLNLTQSGTGITDFDCTPMFEELEYLIDVPGTITYSGTDGNLPESVLDEAWEVYLSTSPAGAPELNDWKAEIDTNRFRMYQEPGQTVTETWVWYLSLQSGFTLSGDFDIEIYLEDYLRTGGGDTYMMFYVGTSYVAFSDYTTAGDKFVSSLKGDTWAAATRTSADGAVRIKRVGSTLTSYYHNNLEGSWIQHRTGTDSDDNLIISVRNYLYQNSSDTATTLDYYINKIVINQGTIKWRDNKLPLRKNIALEYNNQQCYMEIEYWDQVAKSAQLWAKIPTIASGTNTDLYLYYDSTTSGNTDYVGDTGDTPAQNVWDSNFVGVYHMAQYPVTTSGVLDSTFNMYHGTPQGSMTSADLVDGLAGKAIEFDGIDDYIDCGTDVSFNLNADSGYTLEAGASYGESATGTIISKMDTDSDWVGYDIQANVTTGLNTYAVSVWPTDAEHLIIVDPLTPDVAFNIGVRCQAYQLSAIFNGEPSESSYPLNLLSGTITNSVPFCIGSRSGFLPAYYDGTIHEVRISNIARSDTWIKATNTSNIDSLITFDDALKIYFSSANPDSITDYGFTSDLSLVVTISGWAPTHAYDIDYYTDVEQQVGSTISGTDSGQSTTKELSTPSGIEYSWYVIATSSGVSDTSSTYTFDNRFLAAGTVETPEGPVSGTLVRLYRRVDGVLVDETLTTSTGTFSIDTPYPEEHYCIAFHEDTTYNALIYDHVEP